MSTNPAEGDYWRTKHTLPIAITGAQESAQIQPREITGEQNTLSLELLQELKSAQIQPRVITGEQNTLSLEQLLELKCQQKSSRE